MMIIECISILLYTYNTWILSIQRLISLGPDSIINLNNHGIITKREA